MALRVQAGDPGTEIFLLDSRLHLAERGIGTLEASVPPGPYKIKLLAGLATQERMVFLSKESEQITFPPIAFASPTPLGGTRKTHEYQVAAAERESRRAHVTLGQGGSIFVFVREWTAPTASSYEAVSASRPNPAIGLTLRSAQAPDAVLVDLAAQSVSDLQQEPWAACRVDLEPGSYVLCLDLASGERIHQLLYVPRSWHLLLFALLRNYGDATPDYRADLGATGMALQPYPEFNSQSPTLRLGELARLALTNQRRALSSELRSMLRSKFDDAMLGIYGAHLLLSEVPVDQELLRTVLGNLQGLIGPHPDVRALSLRAFPEQTAAAFLEPPMLRRSWGLMLEATAARPELIPSGSLADQIADRTWAADPWLLWLRASQGQAWRDAVTQRVSGAARRISGGEFLGRSAEGRSSGFESMAEAASPPSPAALDEDAFTKLVKQFWVPRSRLEAMLRERPGPDT